MSSEDSADDRDLLDAIKNNDDLRVGRLIFSGVNIHKQWFTLHYETPLHAACNVGITSSIAGRLIDSNVSVDIRNSSNMTPLHAAARNENADVVRLLIEQEADINTVDDEGHTPLMWAIGWQTGDECEVVRELIDANADVNLCDKSGNTPLHEAVDSNQLDVVVMLLETGIIIDALDEKGRTPLHRLIRSRTPNPLNENPPAIRAIRVQILRELLKFGANANQCNKDTSYTIPTPEVYDRYKTIGSSREFEYWLFWVQCIDDLSTPLHEAARHNNPWVISALIDYGANVTALENNELTPLALAISCESHSVIHRLNKEISRLEKERITQERKLMVMLGNSSLKDRDNNSLLHLLDSEVMCLIVKSGVDYYEPDDG